MNVFTTERNGIMSKYTKLWRYLSESCLGTETLTFDEIYNICGAYVDDAFMQYKSELENYGLSVVRINLRDRTVLFTRNASNMRYRR